MTDGRKTTPDLAMPSSSYDPAFLVAQNLPAMQETPVRSLGWEDLLEKGVNPCGIKSLNSVLTKARELRCIY